jgi:hypothetical protein
VLQNERNAERSAAFARKGPFLADKKLSSEIRHLRAEIRRMDYKGTYRSSTSRSNEPTFDRGLGRMVGDGKGGEFFAVWGKDDN